MDQMLVVETVGWLTAKTRGKRYALCHLSPLVSTWPLATAFLLIPNFACSPHTIEKPKACQHLQWILSMSWTRFLAAKPSYSRSQCFVHQRK